MQIALAKKLSVICTRLSSGNPGAGSRGKPSSATAMRRRGKNRRDTGVRLSEVFGAGIPEGGAITYLYDFADGWEHAVRLERIVRNYGRNFARCTLMEGDAPPEDAGGPGGFWDMLEILKDQVHPEYAERKRWADGMHWKPLQAGDVEEVNRHLEWREYGFWWY